MKKIIRLVFFLLFIAKASAQQDPNFTQYMTNMSVINPAYTTGNSSVLNLGSLYRYQWAGIKGAPRTMTLFAHMPFYEKVEGGFSLISDDIGNGAKKETNFFADFAYNLKLNEKQQIAFGLKAGFSSISTNFNGFKLNSGNVTTDNAFVENINETVPNIGVGTYFFGKKYYVGLSIPNLLSSKHIKSKPSSISFGPEEIHTFLQVVML